jgi:hypothetical protein
MYFVGVRDIKPDDGLKMTEQDSDEMGLTACKLISLFLSLLP